MKYGFFLGSFDPPHLGHFAVVEKVLKEGLVDHVIMVPAPQNPWKKEKPASLGIRYWMCVDGIKELGLLDHASVRTGTNALSARAP